MVNNSTIEVRGYIGISMIGHPDMNMLSKREIEVVQLIKEGLSSKEIARSLDISLKTVEVHRYNILRKLKLKNTASLVNLINAQGY
jgi:DNA-binding NarL/FixJ family response regulator